VDQHSSFRGVFKYGFQVVDKVKKNAVDIFNFTVLNVVGFVNEVIWKFVFAVVTGAID